MIIERTEYYAKPGLAEEVLAIRRKASTVRRALGLASGRIFVNLVNGGEDVPDVAWECTFTSPGEQREDLAARDASADFAAVREEMRRHTARFARRVLQLDDAPVANGMRPTELGGLPIVPDEITFISDGLTLKGYLYQPPGPGPFPCLITNHGSGIDRGTFDVCRPGTAALLMSWGIASFLPHRRGYGNSEGTPWREEATAEFGTALYDEQIVARLDRESDDVIAALDCVSAMEAIDSRHIGVMGSSFGGINTLLAAAKDSRLTCAVEFAGAAMNWDRTPRLRAFLTETAGRLTQPIFFAQAENDYSIRPTRELAASLDGTGKTVWSKIYPAFGLTPMEGHLLESRGAQVWSADVHRFLERYL